MADAPTPMMRQYRRIRDALPREIILFFRLGDFYEMFFEDAKAAAPILDIALTRRNGVPMCGVPYHAAESYLAKLIRGGKKVAVCDQVEDSAAARGIVRREVTRVVTPGTVTADAILEANRNNFLAGLCRRGGTWGLAFLDLSTGLFFAEQHQSLDALRDSLAGRAPSECVLPAELAADEALTSALGQAATARSACEDWTFSYEAARSLLTRHFGVQSLDGFGCEGAQAVVGAAGGVLQYVKEELRHEAGHVRGFHVRQTAELLVLDEATCRNLDLLPAPGPRRGTSLLEVLDATCTAMGGRLLRDWMLRPRADLASITARHEAVAEYHGDRSRLCRVREALREVRDLERLIARIGSGGANARDLRALAHSVSAVPAARALIEKDASALSARWRERLVPLPELVELVERSIAEEPPATLREGGVIRRGYSEALDGLRSAATEGRQWLAEYQASEQTRTGIRNLKVRHNKVFGYYIEVTKGQLERVPDDYQRKQTLVNAERFITPELKQYENRIMGAQERAAALEYELFAQVRGRVVEHTEAVQRIAGSLAELDVIACLADRALALGYARPRMTDGDELRITAGRHPVIECMPEAERFVPNDTRLDCREHQLAIVTGPNMAGKSTYIRQVALIVVMAQMGSYVPAEAAAIGCVDRVFTRVGASDDLVRGRSTFMVEMQETANILNNATPRSLIVLDEIGRGTSTFDGISIAWAVAEYLHRHEQVKAKTLFATHYHELTDLAVALKGVQNYNVLVRERDDQVVFLRKIVPGAADKSYGIQVARLAGMPPEVIDRAKEILANLEEEELGETGQPSLARRRSRRSAPDNTRQLSLFNQS